MCVADLWLVQYKSPSTEGMYLRWPSPHQLWRTRVVAQYVPYASLSTSMFSCNACLHDGHGASKMRSVCGGKGCGSRCGVKSSCGAKVHRRRRNKHGDGTESRRSAVRDSQQRYKTSLCGWVRNTLYYQVRLQCPRKTIMAMFGVNENISRPSLMKNSNKLFITYF